MCIAFARLIYIYIYMLRYAECARSIARLMLKGSMIENDALSNRCRGQQREANDVVSLGCKYDRFVVFRGKRAAIDQLASLGTARLNEVKRRDKQKSLIQMIKERRRFVDERRFSETLWVNGN